MTDSIKLFEAIERLSLATLDTPIEKCERLKLRYPHLPNLYVKRDDFIGSLVWGNKLRKLEYTLSDAVSKGADTIITYGGIQSNHARIAAQVSRRLGFECVLVLHGEKPDVPSANFKILNLLDIPIHYVNSREERLPKMKALAAEFEREGKKVYSIPLGASDHIGSMGFVNAAKELKAQQESLGVNFNYLFHSGSSGGTQAGLLVGKQLYGLEDLKVKTISADDPSKEIRHFVMEAMKPMAEKLKIDISQLSQEIDISDEYIGEGYGIPTILSAEVTEAFAHIEGITLDSTYTAKAASAIFDLSEKGILKSSDNVLLWHTGGLLTLFKYE